MESVYHIAPQPARSDAGGLRQPRATKPDARAKPQRAASATRERVIMVPTDANAHPTCKHCLVPVKLCHCSAGKASRAAACARCGELERELSAAQAASERRALELEEAHATERRQTEGRLRETERRLAELQGEVAAAQAQLQGSEVREAELAAQLAAAQATIQERDAQLTAAQATLEARVAAAVGAAEGELASLREQLAQARG